MLNVNFDKAPQYRLAPELHFLQHLWRLNHALERLSIRMEKSLGVTAQQRLVIRCIGQHPDMTAGQLARILHLDPGTVSATLKRLEDKRVLARRRDRRDQRRVMIRLTLRGKALNRPSSGTVEHAVARLLKTARAADITATTAVLSRLILLLTHEAQ